MSKVFNMVGGGGGGIKLTGISILTQPSKTTYTAGETFDPAGMVVQATYSNGATLQATGYTYSPSTALTDGTTEVTIVYTEGGVSASATQAVTVVHRLESIAVTTQPSKTVYEYGDSFASSGMVVRASYSDGATANVTGFSCSPSTLSTVGTQTVTVSYTERSVTKTTTLSVTVERKSISTVPSQSGSLTYSGSAQSPSWSNYNSAQLTLGGVTSGTNAGSYNATFAPTANYRWSDGTTTAKTVAWSIGKAAGSLSISPTSMTLDMNNKTKTITVTRAGDGAISAVSGNTAAATVSISGNTVTVTGKANGSATITVSVAAGTNHTAPSSKTCAVTVSFLDDTFANNDWSAIIAACQSGSVPDSWVAGNSKTMTINGTSYQIDIIGKNHDTYATGGTAPLTFQMHDAYDEQGKMNDSSTTTGGWEACDMRNLELPQILSLMPSEIKDAIRLVQKKSGAGRMSSDITITNDKLFLLAEIEVFGEANESVQGEGIQYDYYAAGNSPKKEKDGELINWWLRSPERLNNQRFIFTTVNGRARAYSASSSLYTSFAFCF